MAEQHPDDMRLRPRDADPSGFDDLDAALNAAIRSVATRESYEEIVRLLRERIRILQPRSHPLDDRIREQGLRIQEALRALAEAHRRLRDVQRPPDDRQ